MPESQSFSQASSTPSQIPQPASSSTGSDKKVTTKAERRAIQESQRAAKAAAITGSNKSKQPLKTDVKKSNPVTTATLTTLASGKNVSSSKTPMASTSAQLKPIHDILSWQKEKQVSLFQHLDYPKGLDTQNAYGSVHPLVLSFGVKFASYKICGSNARTIATLTAFAQVIRDYKTPPNQALSRHLLTFLSPQIQFLVNSRPMGVGMGNAIRYLKHQIVTLDPNIPEEDAKEALCTKIDEFIRERIIIAGQVIANYGIINIKNGDVIMTFGKSSLIENVILTAHKNGIQFHVVCVDSRPRNEGRNLMRVLVNEGINCSYIHQIAAGGRSSPVRDVTKVLLGAHALLSNGALYSRAGTASIAMAAKDRGIPVIACCEAYKFTDRVQLDSFVINELGSPDELIHIGVNDDNTSKLKGPLTSWKNEPNLKLLNLMYDVTPPEFINMVITELGSVPVSSIPVILREYRYAS